MANTHTNLASLFTSIADAIREKIGTTQPIVADDFPNEIAKIPTGIDTSDATATADDILSGATAYVNGVMIEGCSTKNADTSGDTVTEDVLLEGYTAHDSSGNPISGYYSPLSLLDASVDASSSDVTNLTIDVQNMDDRLMNITLTFGVETEEFHIANCVIYLTVSI